MLLRNLRILFVEDDPAQAAAVRRSLTRNGTVFCEVDNVDRLSEAISRLGNRTYDAVLLDLGLPDSNGLQTLETLYQFCPHIPVVVLTATDDPEGALRSLELGAQDYLLKGQASGDTLCRAICYAIQRQQMRVENQRLLAEMKELAWTDPLTGVLNRRTFFELFKGEWSRASREYSPLSCVLLDIDFFKRVNDTLGHTVGDAALQSVAKLLREHCRASDSVCRFGGEEFCILLPHANEAGAAHWADRLRQRVSEMTVEAAGRELRITASFGVAERLDDTRGPEELLDRADQALLVAKQSGRDCVVTADSLRNPTVFAHLEKRRTHDPFDGVLARDVMTAVVACLEQDDSIDRAAEFLLQLRIGSAPVVDGDGKLVGIVSEKDLMARMVSCDSWQTSVREVMRTNVVCYDEQTQAREIFQFLRRVSIRRVIVVQAGRPTGVISRGSLLRWFRNWVSVQESAAPRASESLSGQASVHADILRTADALAERGEFLPRHLRDNAEDFIPSVVGEATRMQELINDLLGHCQAAATLAPAPLTPPSNDSLPTSHQPIG